MKTYRYVVPESLFAEVTEVAASQHITTDEALNRLIRVGLSLYGPDEAPAKVSNAELFGSVRGAGAHGSKEAIDDYLSKLRSEW